MKRILIVGAGLTGAVFANTLKDLAKVTVIDKRNHIAGNTYLSLEEGIKVHKYGAHIFHTNNERVWEFMMKYGSNSFVPYTHKVKAINNGKYYTLPFNLTTLEELRLSSFIETNNNFNNLEDYCINTVGWEVYDKLIRDYTTKQWGVEPKYLPASIIKRIPIRNNRDDRYFTDKYQGLFDYNSIVEKLLNGVEVLLNTDFFVSKQEFESNYDIIIYTGAIDKLCDYRYGVLGWRSIKFETEVIGVEQYQSLPVINYTNIKEPYTRIIEHKNFPHYHYKLPYTIISKEYSSKYELDKDPDYPINTEVDRELFIKYREYVKANMSKYVLCGRLADYVYIDMHQAIDKAIIKSNELYNNLSQVE